MKTPGLLFLSLLSISLASCSSSIETFSDRDTKVDIKKYKTYAWIAPGDSVLNAPRRDKLFGGFIMQTANEELKKKGMRIETNQPDALFVFQTHVEGKVEYTQSPTVSVGVGIAGPGYYAGGSVPVAGGEIRSVNYEEGTLTVNMYDTRTGAQIWIGGAKGVITNSTDIEQMIRTALHYIFMRLPVKHKG